MPMTNFLKNELYDHLLRGEAYNGPATYYVGLWRKIATLDANSTGSTAGEMSEAGYARQPITQGTSSFPLASGGATSNSNVITFGPLTEDAQEIDKVAILDALTGGNMLWYGSLTAAKTLSNGDDAQFAIGDLDFS